MAGKRIATTELNHENWEDYEPEEAGSFKKAPEEVLQQRVIKTAKRRNPISSVNQDESSSKNVFSSFGGFGKSAPATVSPFAFLSSLTNSTASKTNGISNSISSSVSNITIPNIEANTSIKPPENGTQASSFVQNPLSKTSPTKTSTDYYAKLKGLNESVSQWIKTHVDKNPFCILTPIFKDYEKYLTDIEENSENNKQITELKTSTETKSFSFTSTASTSTTSIFGNSAISKPLESNIFVSQSADKQKETEKSPFGSIASTQPLTFGTSSSTATSAFTFGSGKPFTFTNVSTPKTETKPEETVDEEDEPPKAEFTPVVEDGNIFSKRCKVFVKKDGTFGDRGVGQLFLKPVSGSEKVQLIVRADTNLGNLLLNFILSDSIPMQRMGKNNVMLVCIPNPDSKPPPVPILLRVKTGEEADELLKILEKNKK